VAVNFFNDFRFSVIIIYVFLQQIKSELAFETNSNFDCCNNTENN
jgi:hypothetical protein